MLSPGLGYSQEGTSQVQYSLPLARAGLGERICQNSVFVVGLDSQ